MAGLNPMAIMAFLAKYPGIMTLVSQLPNFKADTVQLLMAFLKKAVEQTDPEEFLRAAIQQALKEPQKVVSVQATVVGQAPNLPRK